MEKYSTEIWKEIVGYEGLYEVSSKGRIYSHFMKGIKKKRLHNGYEIIDLTKDDKKSTVSVHRLVAIAFIENPKNKPAVNHINEIKSDNSVENLMWATYKENSNWGTLKERQKKIVNERMSDKKYREKMVWYRSEITRNQVEQIKKLLCGDDSVNIIAGKVNVSINSVKHIQWLNSFVDVLPELNDCIYNRNKRIRKERIDEVIRLYKEGFTYKEIADKLNVNPATPYRICKKHLNNEVG